MSVDLVTFHVCIVKLCDVPKLRTDWYILYDIPQNKPCVILHNKIICVSGEYNERKLYVHSMWDKYSIDEEYTIWLKHAIDLQNYNL
jgi:hypothetical protein